MFSDGEGKMGLHFSGEIGFVLRLFEERGEAGEEFMHSGPSPS